MFSAAQLLKSDPLWFSCQITHHQFSAISSKLSSANLLDELTLTPYFGRVTKSRTAIVADLEKWLLNSWNTEIVMQNNASIINDTSQSFAIQWCFAQAYYSCYANIMTKFIALGYTESSHTAVMKKYALNAKEGKLPKSISFLSLGSKKNILFENITKPAGVTQFEFDPARVTTIDNQICQFLKSTREIDLDDRAVSMRKEFKSKSGRIKKNLNASDWVKVSDALGHTGLLDLLYRKRIKANYKDIDTFTSGHLDGLRILNDLSVIVDRFNFVNEAFTAKVLGQKDFEAILNKYNTFHNPRRRFEEYKSII